MKRTLSRQDNLLAAGCWGTGLFCARFLSLGLVALVAIGCAAPALTKPHVERYWPVPPDPPRIVYLQEFSHPKDMGEKRNWFRKLFRMVFGEKQAPHVLRPLTVTVDKRGKIYITDTGLQAVHVYDWSAKEYDQIFWIEPGISRLISPAGVAVDENGNVYVSDSQLNTIFVYEPKRFSLVRTIGAPGGFDRPGGLAFHPANGLLYVADAGGHRLMAFDSEGRWIKTIGKRGGEAGQFNFPSHIAIDRNGWLYVTDTMNFRIQIFDSDGNFVNQFGQLGNTLGTFSKPKGVAVDSEGHIYVVDGIYDAIQIFDQQGRLLLRFGKTGEGPGDMWLPNGIFIDRLDRIYVADTYNQRIQVFQYLRAPASEEASQK